MHLIEIEFAERLAGVGGFLGFFEGLGKALVEEVFLVLLGFDGLAEDALFALFLFAEVAGGLVEVFESAFARRGVCAMMARVAASILRMAPQSGQVRSKVELEGDFPFCDIRGFRPG